MNKKNTLNGISTLFDLRDEVYAMYKDLIDKEELSDIEKGELIAIKHLRKILINGF